MRQRLTFLVLLSLSIPLLMSGCGWFNDDRGVFVDPRDDYLDAKTGRTLTIPADLKGENLGDPQPIPPTPRQENANYYPNRPPLPDAIYGDDKAEEVRIQRIGQRRWLVVPEDATTIWPKLKQFFAENGVRVAQERTTDGRIDTDWLTVGDEPHRDVVRATLQDVRAEVGVAESALTSERLLLRIERGLREDTSEIHLRHKRRHDNPPVMPGLVGTAAGDEAVEAEAVEAESVEAELDMAQSVEAESGEDKSVGDNAAADEALAAMPVIDTPVTQVQATPEYQRDIANLTSDHGAAEHQILNEIGAYIAAKVSEQTISMVATRITTQAKSLMERDTTGAPALRLNLDWERAWATVGQALSNAEVEVLDVDADNRRYHVKILESTFSGEEPGFFGRMFGGGKGGAQEFKLQLAPAADAATNAYWVTVRDAKDEKPQRDVAQQLLVLVREYAG